MSDDLNPLFDEDESLSSVEHVLYEEAGGLPDCVLEEGARCRVCVFGDYEDCPVLSDPDVRSYLRWKAEQTAGYYRERGKKLAVLKSILVKHKLPLHWEVIALIAINQSPELFDSVNGVRMLLFFNERTFEHKGDGVFTIAKD